MKQLLLLPERKDKESYSKQHENQKKVELWNIPFITIWTDRTHLLDLQQIHLASDANSHPLEKLLLELQQVLGGKLYRAWLHGLCGQMPWFCLTSTMRGN